jgi:hypothetical protein
MDNFLKDLDKGLADKAAKDKAEKQDKKYDKATDKAKAFATNVGSLIKLLSPFSQTLKPDERDKLLEGALAGLLGALIGDGGDDLTGAVHDLVNIARGKMTAEEKRKKIDDVIKKLVSTIGKSAAGKETGKGLGEITASVLTLIQIARGELTDAKRDEVLIDAGWKLVESDLVKRQLEWFVSENFLTYGQAVKIGYDLGKPFGDYIARELAPVGQYAHWRDFLIAIEQKDSSWVDDVGARHDTVTAVPGGSFSKWQVTVYWDVTVNDIRIQVISPSNTVTILNKDGLDVTGEAGGTPTEVTSVPPENYREGEITQVAQSNVDRTMTIAENDPKVKELKSKMDELHETAIATETAAVAAQRAGDTVTAAGLEAKYRIQYSAYWLAREKWKRAIHEWFVKAATAEKWGTLEKSYMWRRYRIFAAEDWELGTAVPGGLTLPGGKAGMPVAVGRAGIYALVATILLAAVGGFLIFGRSSSGPTASNAPAASAPAASVQAGVICAPAPDISIAMSGAASATVTKGCVPTQVRANRNSTTAPNCRLEGIPNPPNTVAGVLAVGFAFLDGGTRYEVTLSYVADNRDPVNHGALPATIRVAPDAPVLGDTSVLSFPATREFAGSQGTTYRGSTGVYTFSGAGTSGTVDMDYKTPEGKTLHLKGSFRIAGGCAPRA